MYNISDIIKHHRKKSGLSQKELADLAGLGKTVIFDIEKGKDTVQWSTLESVFRVLNITLKFESPLITDSGKENNMVE
jgi:y4mF family transcriptional regulator